MKTENIKKLLISYYNGVTTREEENMLSNYFHSDNVSPELEDEKIVFLHIIDYAEKIPINLTLESKLDNLITELAIQKKEESLEETSLIVPKTKKIKYILSWIISVAACIMILFTIGFFMTKKDHTKQPNAIVQTELKDTYSDPNKAYAEAEKALLLISKNLNKGLVQLEIAQENVDKSRKIVKKGLKQITTN